MKKLAICFSFLAFVALLTFAALPGVHADGPGDKARSVTFTRDVAPIFYKNCAECHKPNDIAPMSLIAYKDARPWAQSIREMVATRQMPPWHADPHYGQFKNDRTLSQSDVDTIVAWVDQGAAEGNPKDLPALPGSLEGWQIGQPDVVLSMPEEYKIPANGPDEYIYITIPTNFKEDKWVQAAEFHPGNKAVVHHVIAFIQPPEVAAMLKAAGPRGAEAAALGGKDSIFYRDGSLIRVKADAPVIDDGCGNPNGGSSFGSGSGGMGGMPLLAGYAPGKDIEKWEPGTAMKIPAGSNIVFQMHYSNFRGAMNKPETDRTSLGIVFAKEPPKKMAVAMGVLNDFFQIPAGDPDHVVTACQTLDRDVQVIDYMPHMHLRGKAMKYEAVFPDGRRETLMWVPKYSFNWQTVYYLKEPVSLPKGTKLIITAHFDNSEQNKYNPDPTKVVRWGDPTYDDMAIGWLHYTVPVPAEKVAIKLDPKVYDQYIGVYQFTPKFSVTVSRDGDRLLGQVSGQMQVQLFPESETKFFLKVMNGELTFTKDASGQVNGVSFNMNGMVLHAKKVEPSAAGVH
ncbi:MAG TPA: DUF3471 domain-containing protein [Blastocatellia bacterium]|nr:DUF3471 domain-containing protein [Blastocatellia bacterium]